LIRAKNAFASFRSWSADRTAALKARIGEDQRVLLRWALYGLAAFLLAPYALVLAYKLFDPPFSALMVRQTLMGRLPTQEWRDLSDISPNLIRQVIVSEDGSFCSHWGVDWEAVERAITDAERGKPRGASTISMQTVKNLFLWNSPSAPRKVLEIPLAYFADFVWGKHRMLEIYLNIAEWGPGIFGAEAAARHYFGVTAAELNQQEAAQLAAALPNPKKRNAGNPGPGTSRIARYLRNRAQRSSDAAECVLRRY
jgi:monofunctional biosynthetic peptidoglycan transglycosylase